MMAWRIEPRSCAGLGAGLPGRIAPLTSAPQRLQCFERLPHGKCSDHSYFVILEKSVQIERVKREKLTT